MLPTEDRFKQLTAAQILWLQAGEEDWQKPNSNYVDASKLTGIVKDIREVMDNFDELSDDEYEKKLEEIDAKLQEKIKNNEIKRGRDLSEDAIEQSPTVMDDWEDITDQIME